MSKHTRRDRHDAVVVSLARGQGGRVAAVRQLPPEALHQIIQRQGLDASAELVTSATADQLRSVFDLDVWRAAAGRDATFDAERFGEWLELLAELGTAAVTRLVAALGPDIVAAGLSQYVRIFDGGVFMPTAQSDDEPAATWGDALGSLTCELSGYVVTARRSESWDAIVTLLGALDADSPECFHALMVGCRRLSNSAPEIDGLDDLLNTSDQLLYDLSGERDDRRSKRGYNTAADARAFLELARRRRVWQSDEPLAAKRLVEAYFQEAWPASGQPADDELGARELAFLANTLMAGCSLQGRPFTAAEAASAAVAVCRLGLAADAPQTGTDGGQAQTRTDGGQPQTDTDSHRRELALAARTSGIDFIGAFEIGWSTLYERVTCMVGRSLADVLGGLRCVDPELDRELHELRRELMRRCEAGDPWRARDALDAVAVIDLPAWASLLGLLSECPVLPEALVATLERRTGAVSATAFEFIATLEQIGAVERFMTRLPQAMGA